MPNALASKGKGKGGKSHAKGVGKAAVPQQVGPETEKDPKQPKLRETEEVENVVDKKQQQKEPEMEEEVEAPKKKKQQKEPEMEQAEEVEAPKKKNQKEPEMKDAEEVDPPKKKKQKEPVEMIWTPIVRSDHGAQEKMFGPGRLSIEERS